MAYHQDDATSHDGEESHSLLEVCQQPELKCRGSDWRAPAIILGESCCIKKHSVCSFEFTIFLYILWHDATTYQMVSCYVPDSGLRIVILDIHHMCLHILLFIQCNVVAFLGGIFSYICGFVPIKINKRII